jgi:hypothetical protein
VKYNGSATVPTNAATYAVTADFVPTDTTNYNSLPALSAGDFSHRQGDIDNAPQWETARLSTTGRCTTAGRAR